MKTKNILTTLFTACVLTVASQAHAMRCQGGTIDGVPVSNATVTRQGDNLLVKMDLEFAKLKIKGDKAVLFTPCLINGTDTLKMQPVGLYSRSRWYQFERKGDLFMGGADEIAMRYNKRPDVMAYEQVVPYQNWMNGANLEVLAQTYACCGKITGTDQVDLGLAMTEYTPSYLYRTIPDVLSVTDYVKSRELSGRAFVDFPVNQIVIYPDYRNNQKELGKIIGTIDSVRNDPDVTVTSIFIKGTASPEGPYANNVRLAKGRTEALKDYVTKLYNFPNDFIKTDYEPVDWAGLREWLEQNQIENRDEILAIVNSDLEPFARNKKIETTYPAQYKFLHANVYPALRHSDYRIEYNIRHFSTVEEIAALLHSNPGKLSLNEMIFLAQSYEPGSDQFNDAWEVIVRLYPDDETANLNVAVSALNRGDKVSVDKYLPKAGNSPEANFARANYAFTQGNYTEAADYLKKASSLPQAQSAYQELIVAGYIQE